jgi:hypothetical protein
MVWFCEQAPPPSAHTLLTAMLCRAVPCCTAGSLSLLPPGASPHAIAGLLKRFLLGLPEPLLTYRCDATSFSLHSNQQQLRCASALCSACLCCAYLFCACLCCLLCGMRAGVHAPAAVQVHPWENKPSGTVSGVAAQAPILFMMPGTHH